MKICILGNCQIAPLRTMLLAMLGDVEIPSLPAVHTLKDQHRGAVEQAVREADWVIAQWVAPDYPASYVTSDHLRRVCGERLILWPNLYFAGYAPEFNTLRSAEYSNFTGPLLDYHSEKVLIAFMLNWSVERTVQFLSEPSRFDERYFERAASDGVANLKQRETNTDVSISDFVERHFASRRLFHIMNHPSAYVLEELAARVLQKACLQIRHRTPSFLFAESELLSAWHPENPYMRRRHGFQFAEHRLYKGVRLIKADTRLGFAPAGPRIYDEQGFVEAMFAFYGHHASALREHARVKQALDRYERRG